MKALVTGGAGFIGGHIARDLVRRNFEVTIVDNLHTGDLKNIPKEAKFYNLNISSDEISFLFEDLAQREHSQSIPLVLFCEE